MVWDEILRAREVWLGKRPGIGEWPHQGIAIEGDFAGIQQYVLKPVPGAKGAAKRLRGRSLQVSAITELIAGQIRDQFAGANAKVFYSAGGRFLISASQSDGWEERLTQQQKRLDEWIGAQFRGEVMFHLAAANFSDGLIPRKALGTAMQHRKERALAYFLKNENGWKEENFLREPAHDAFVCPACLMTSNGGVIQPDEQGEKICDECHRDKKLGAKLAQSKQALISQATDGEIEFLDKTYTLGESGLPANTIHHMPRDGGDAMDLDEIAQECVGSRKFLAYLRIDADGIGAAFRKLNDDPARVQALSGLLQRFFCDYVQEVIKKGAGRAESKYRWLYPVYGGGDDLFVIGPWDLALDFAEQLAAEFTKATAGELSFSAGLTLSKSKQHILSKSEEAEIALNEHAKKRVGKAAIHAFGETFGWREFPGVLRSAKNVTVWYERNLVSSQFLQLLLTLHAEWRAAVQEKDEAKQVRYRPMLHYQMERNFTKAEQMPVKHWVAKILAREATDSDASWAAIGFITRYAMLAAKKDKKEDV